MPVPVLGDRLRAFVLFAQGLKGDEKGEAQTYINQLMVAFGNGGAIQAGGTFERRIKAEKTTLFADYELPGKALIEMKKRGANLADHYQQAFNYWTELVPHRPAYVILCNFDEIWIYDFNRQLRAPLQKIPLHLLAEKEQFQALRFLEPDASSVLPKFADDRVKVTKEAADLVADVYNSLVGTKGTRPGGAVPEAKAQRYILQCLVALYSEDAGLLPEDLFETVLKEAVVQKNAYDLVGGLFRQMNDPHPAAAGRYKGVDYFNGGLFATVEPLDLHFGELNALIRASKEFDWEKVEPEIFGTLFQKSMGEKARHAYGAHYTSPIDIMKVVNPTIVRPWDRAIDGAEGYDALLLLRKSLARYRVLDPACGSGNFLYVAYRELKAVERRLLRRMLDADRDRTLADLASVPFVSTTGFFGLDVLPFAVELAKVTLMLAKELALALPEGDDPEVAALVRDVEKPLPLDNLDANIRLADALFDPWPEADAIIGNPPYLGSRYLAKELGYPYARKLADAYPDVPRMADFVAYFFRRAHDRLAPGGRAGLVGTNTIRQNETREAGLDHIVANGGVILEAVSSQVWSGDAAVYVSIVNWAKLPESLLPLGGGQGGVILPSGGGQGGGTPTHDLDGQTGFALPAENPLDPAEVALPKRLYFQTAERRDAPLDLVELPLIPPALSAGTDVSGAKPLAANAGSKSCYVGQYPFNDGFYVPEHTAKKWFVRDPRNREVVFPYMIGRDLLEQSQPSRLIVDFGQIDQIAAASYKEPFAWLKANVMPDVLAKAEAEKLTTGKLTTRWTRVADRWWQFRDYQPGTMRAIAAIPRYVACSRVSKRPIFEFVASEVHPDNTLVVFPLSDDYSFGILQSGVHFAWFRARCSSLKGDYRYTSDTVFDAFPWPQSPTAAQCRAVADAAVALRALRRDLMAAHGLSLRALYRTLETPGKNPLRVAQDALDRAVRAAYGMPADADPLAFLLNLNLGLAAIEGEPSPPGEGRVGVRGTVTPPGLPAWIEDRDAYVTDDCIRPAPL